MASKRDQIDIYAYKFKESSGRANSLYKKQLEIENKISRINREIEDRKIDIQYSILIEKNIPENVSLPNQQARDVYLKKIIKEDAFIKEKTKERDELELELNKIISERKTYEADTKYYKLLAEAEANL